MHALHKLLFFHVLTSLGRDGLGGKIINGKKAPVNSMLYMASLQNSKGQHACGGFLISDDFVLTAAHCGMFSVFNLATRLTLESVEETTLKYFEFGLHDTTSRVVLGTHDLKRAANGKTRFIEKIYAHSFFQDAGHGKDIMLLKLSKKAQLDNSVQTIQLPTSEMNIGENEICQVAGWGKTSSHGTTVDELQVVDVSTINMQVCKQQWPGLPGNVICAGGYSTTKGFCQGDSGGPLVCNGKAVGIVSFNRGGNCSYPDFPNVYTDISKYLPWINNILKQNNR